MFGFAIDQISCWFQVSAQPPAKKTAGLIEKETDERRMTVFYLFKKDFAKRFHPSSFVIRHSLFCGSLFQFCVVSHEVSVNTESRNLNTDLVATEGQHR